MLLTRFLIIFGLLLESQLTQSQDTSLKVNISPITGTVTIEGKVYVYYELQLINTTRANISVNSIFISDRANRTEPMALSDDQLKNSFSGGSVLLKPGIPAWVYLEIVVQKTKASIQLNHQITYVTKGQASKKAFAIVSFVTKKPVVVNAPLQGTNWAAIYDPSWQRGHRRVIFTVEGKPRLPGRFAIDFIRLNNAGHFAAADKDSIKNWFGYQADVLAVSNGVIASALDSFPETARLSSHPGYDSSRATGNYISLKIRDSVYAFYEHLIPGSVLVKPGDSVKTGQVIAKLGFTGQSTGPHLHFHLADRNSPLDAEGIPYVFNTFKRLGFYPKFDDFGVKTWTPVRDKTGNAFNERPASNSVIVF